VRFTSNQRLIHVASFSGQLLGSPARFVRSRTGVLRTWLDFRSGTYRPVTVTVVNKRGTARLETVPGAMRRPPATSTIPC